MWKIGKIEKQNKEMKEILLKLIEDSEEYYDHLLNSRELSLDIFDKMQERS